MKSLFRQHRAFTFVLFICCAGLLAFGFVHSYGRTGAAAQDNPGGQSSPGGLWEGIGTRQAERMAGPVRAFRLKQTTLTEVLNRAPREFSLASKANPVELALPLPDGSFSRFQIESSSVMEPALAARFPEIKTYSAQGLDEPGATARLTWSPRGLHALLLLKTGAVTIHPASPDDTTIYLSYSSENQTQDAKEWRCLVEQKEQDAASVPTAKAPAASVGGTLRVYRIAIAVTQEYTNQANLGGGSVAGALASITAWLSSVNAILEREVAVRLVLVANNNLVIFTAEPDGFTNGANNTMLSEVPGILSTNIGSANFDIGHVLGVGGGGVASLGVICDSSTSGTGQAKARGASAVAGPTGEITGLTVLTHELGHQLGASHTFNLLEAAGTNCGPENRFGPTGYEVASGATLMSYRGLCGANLAAIDMRFHAGSFAQITAKVATATCNQANWIPTSNTPPLVNAGGNFTIPQQTPFTLTASGFDVNASDLPNLTYTWDQIDAGGALYFNPPYGDQVGDPATTTRPLFRPLLPSLNPARTFPSLTYILNNANVPPATVNGAITGENLPSVARTMNFRATVRDNRSNGGGVNEDTAVITVDGSSGPFAVTAPNGGNNFSGGTGANVTWNVANTNGGAVNVANVKISLSTDGGQTFPFVLAASTPNDGIHPVSYPFDLLSTTARVKVEAVGNIFFDISDANFTLTPGSGCAAVSAINPIIGNVGTAVTITGTGFTGVTAVRFSSNVTASFTILTDTTILTTVPAGATTGRVTLVKPGCANVQSGVFTVCPTAPGTLSADDGTQESSFGGIVGNTYYVNRLTPASYPATLSSVQIFFGTELAAGTSLSVLTGTNPISGSYISALPLQETPATVQTQNQFNSYSVPPITITAGDFIVGWHINRASQGPTAATDTSSPNQGRSYLANDGFSYAQAAANLMIRAVIFTGNCAAPPPSNTAPSFIPAAPPTLAIGGPPFVAPINIGLVTDEQTAPGNLAVFQTTGGTATGITAVEFFNNNGTISAQFNVACNATPGTVRFLVSDGSLSGTADLQFNLTPYTPLALTVNNLGDAGDATPGNGVCETAAGNGTCTLRAAMQEINALPQCATIPINFSVNGTISLASPLPDVTTNFTLNGPGANLLTVQRAAAAAGFGIFNIPGSGLNIVINALTISNGSDVSGNTGDSRGGGVDSRSNLTLNNVTVSGNQATYGGGVYLSLGVGTFTNCTFSNNLATGTGSQGGGVLLETNTNGTFTGCTFSGNQATSGGGVQVSDATALLNNCNISSNTATFGGGVRASDATATLTNCTLNGNGNMATTRGGALELNNASGTLTNCTISGNTANFGGGIAIFNTSGNRTLSVTNCTVVNNTSNPTATGGIRVEVAAGLTTTATLRNTIIANNTAPNLTGFLNGVDSPATLVSQGFNLTSDNSTTFLNQATDITNANPLLAALANNGGPTQTHALLAGSPALDKGSAVAGLTTDQRGFLRPSDDPNLPNAAGGNGSDIGAFELPSPTLIVTATADTNDGACLDHCSLREALAVLAQAPGGSISFGPLFNTPQTIKLTLGELAINTSMSINGPGAHKLTVSGNNASRVFNIASGLTVGLSGLTITGGNTANSGGGIAAGSGTLTVSNAVISGNTASSGGGISNLSGTLTVSNSTISGNTANGSGSGGGIHHFFGNLAITNSTISGNRAPNGNNNGGGLWTNNNSTITNCTITNNAAAGAASASGVYRAQSFGTVTLGNSLIAANVNNAAQPDVAADNSSGIISNGYNLIGNRGALSFSGTGDQSGTGAALLNPQLGPLALNGGTTPTHALLGGSPALDKGGAEVTTDQRGLPRPVTIGSIPPASGGNNADIGAVEMQPFIVSNANNSGAGSLRDTIASAPPNSDILFDPAFFNVTRTITLTSGEIALDKSLTINGPGALLLTLSGNNVSRIFRVGFNVTGVSISGLTISNGKAGDLGGGIVSDGDLALTNCAIVNNASGNGWGGGGVYQAGGTGTFTGCTFSGNTAAAGGGLQVINANASFTNCTISGNTASLFGGGVVFDTIGSGDAKTLTITNCTIANNTSAGTGGLQVNSGGGINATATLRNSLIANNSTTNLATTGGATAIITSLGFNLSDNWNGVTILGTDLTAPPLLGTLANHGGPTSTLALLPGSPAINAGTNTGAPATDQRSIARAQQTTTDIGAFESRGFTLAVVSGSGQFAAPNTAFAGPLVVSVSSAQGEPVNGGRVSFTPPGSGPSALLTGNPATIAGGQAGVSATANATGGGPYNVAANATGAAAAVNFALTNAACSPLTINPTNPSLPNGRAGVTYNQTFTQTGGVGTITWSISAGSLPAGLTLTGAVLSGTPTVNGSFSFTIKATDANGCMGTQAYTLFLNPPCATITVNPAMLVNGFQGLASSQTLTATGGSSPYTFAVTTGSLPGGLTLASGGALTGTPTTAGSFNFIVTATDNTGCTGTRSYTMNISGNGLQFYPLAAPVRLLDTRPGQSPNACSQPNAPIAGQTARTQPGRNLCTIPANAVALTGNITTVNSDGGFLTLFPSNAPQPTVANINYVANEIINNVFTVGLGADGDFKIFAFNTTDVVVDLTGYYAPPNPGGLFFHPLPKPIRLLETRPGQPGCNTPGTQIVAGEAGTYTQQGRLTCDNVTIPPGALALVGNATTVNPQGPGFLTLFPANATRPFVAASNFAAGQIVNAPFTVGLAPNGEFKIFTFATTDLVVDVLGYYSTEANDVNGAGLLFSPLAKPVRLLETRNQPVGCFKPGVPLSANTETAQPVRGVCDGITIPANALGVVGNATVVFPSAPGYLTLWPSTAARPLVATSNYIVGDIGNRHFIVGLGLVDGAFKIYTFATTDVVIDLSGYFAP
jgi:CSLREA domain-containing protein